MKQTYCHPEAEVLCILSDLLTSSVSIAQNGVGDLYDWNQPNEVFK